jgi:hypothetical protein
MTWTHAFFLINETYSILPHKTNQLFLFQVNKMINAVFVHCIVSFFDLRLASDYPLGMKFIDSRPLLSLYFVCIILSVNISLLTCLNNWILENQNGSALWNNTPGSDVLDYMTAQDMKQADIRAKQVTLDGVLNNWQTYWDSNETIFDIKWNDHPVLAIAKIFQC